MPNQFVKSRSTGGVLLPGLLILLASLGLWYLSLSITRAITTPQFRVNHSAASNLLLMVLSAALLFLVLPVILYAVKRLLSWKRL
jgi:hypothetical protein